MGRWGRRWGGWGGGWKNNYGGWGSSSSSKSKKKKSKAKAKSTPAWRRSANYMADLDDPIGILGLSQGKNVETERYFVTILRAPAYLKSRQSRHPPRRNWNVVCLNT